MRELMARVRAALRRDSLSRAAASPTNEAPVLEAGSITLDRRARTVHRLGAPVELRPKEFELLEYLMAHSGQALSREQIVAQVWGDDFEGITRTVDVHVHALRHKLEDNPAAPTLIATVRGVGYRFAG